MADHGQAEYATAEGNDLPAHEAMYDRFVHLIVVGGAHVANIVLGLAIGAVEHRVAATPDTVKKMKGLGAEVAVEPGAGTKSGIPDAEFIAAGATVVDSAVEGADVVLKVRRPTSSELARYKRGALVIAV